MRTKSPFPGMDPYLERHWGDFHHSLIQYARDQLQEKLPDSLRARVQERVYVEADEGWSRSFFPDVRIVERRPEGAGKTALEQTGEEAGAVAVAEPIHLLLPVESLTEGYIEIRDAGSGNRVVTVIEVLSPSNKAGKRGTDEYKRKQQEVLSGEASLVEIDLLRRGMRVTAAAGAYVPAPHDTPYHVCVHRGWAGEEFEFYPIQLRERLPIIRIPLRKSDKDARLDLQALMDQTYRMGRYDDLDYKAEADPKLEGEDAAWADEVLKKEGLR